MTKETLPIVARAEARFAFYSGQASTVCRTLALSAIGIVWLFAPHGADSASLAPTTSLHAIRAHGDLLKPLNFAVWYLVFDATQYVLSALLWSLHRWTIERIAFTEGFDGSVVEYLAYYLADAMGTVRYLRRVAGLTGGERYRGLAAAVIASRTDSTLPLAESFTKPLVPSFIPTVATVCFVAKIVCLIICYASLRALLDAL